MEQSVHDQDAGKPDVQKDDEHDSERMLHGTQCIAQDLQEHVDEVKRERDPDHRHTEGNDVRVLRECGKQEFRQKDADGAHSDRGSGPDAEDGTDTGTDPDVLPGPEILTDKDRSRLPEGQDRIEQQQFHFEVDGERRDGDRSESVDLSSDQHVRKRDQHGLQPGREADGEDIPRFVPDR